MGGVILTGFWVVLGSLGVALGLGVYGLPTIVAIVRKSPNLALIATVNLVLGGLVVPWWIALGMALWSTKRRGNITVVQSTNMPLPPAVALPGETPASRYAAPQRALPAVHPPTSLTTGSHLPADRMR